MLAIIKTGGKQYLVQEGKKIKVEKLEGQKDETVTFNEVLFLGDEKKVTMGKPFVEGAAVSAKIIATKAEDKVSGVKHKSKKRVKKTFGHRQIMTEVEITKIK